jgi:hypothetical protein
MNELEKPAAEVRVSIPTAPYTRGQARLAVRKINEGFQKSLDLYLEFVDRGGPRALGYRTIAECVRCEFNFSQSTFWDRVAEQKLAIERALASGAAQASRPSPPPAADDASQGAPMSSPPPDAVDRAVDDLAPDVPAPDVPEAPPAAHEFADLAGKAAEGLEPPEPASAAPREAGEDDDLGDDPPPATTAEQDLGAWVAATPIFRAEPGLPAHLLKRYVLAAMAWRRLADARQAYLRAVRQELDAARRDVGEAPPQYLVKLSYALRQRGPDEWVICRDCGGTGSREVAGLPPGPCPTCKSDGFHA